MLAVTMLAVVLPASLARGQSLKHIIIIVKENRSFDHYFGQFPGVTGGPITSFNCFGTLGGCPGGGTVAAIPADPTQGDADCGHSFYNSVSDYSGGLMNRFNQNCSDSPDWAKQYGATTIPTYWSYATNYGLADHMFASAMGPSYPNHLYLFAATSNEAQNNPGMTAGHAPNGTGANDWTCDAFHYGRCTGDGTTLCSTNSDCTGLGSCKIDSGTGHCSVSTSTACTLDSDCAASGGGYCSNGNTYTGTFYGIDIEGGTGNQMYPGVCSVHRTVGCNAICTVAGQTCSVTTDCNVSSPTSNCSITDPVCAALSGDVCDASSQQFLSAARGSACPNVTTIADRLEGAGVTWGMYYSTGNTSTTDQKWNPVGYVQHLRYGTDWSNNVHPSAQFVADAAACTSDTSCSLPSVVWVTGAEAVSEHPPQLVATGEAWTATQVNAIMSNSYLWSNSTIFITWDDFGGFADHLAPSQDLINWTDGIRVPLLCVGRFCKKEITTTVFTHASLLKCIEDNFGVTALFGDVDGSANDVCFAAGGMMSFSQNNPFPAGATTTTVSSTLNPSAYDQTVALSATVTADSSGTPTGSVAFSDGSTPLGTAPLSGNTATLSTAALTAGHHPISASYSGDSFFNGSAGFLSQTVSQATTTVNVGSSANPSALEESVTFTARITTQYGGQATGTVTFADGSTSLGNATVSSNLAKLTTSILAVGTHPITAAYLGDGNFIPSTSNTLSQVVSRATTATTLASSVNPSASGQSVTFIATVSSPGVTPTGSVTFENGSTVLATVGLTNGSATYTTSKLPLGSNKIGAVYGGDSSNNGSTATLLNQVVLRPTTTALTSSLNPSTFGQAVLFTASVTSGIGAPPAGETVVFKQGSTVLGTGTLGSSGTATFSTSTLGAGTKAVTAVYSGDSTFATSTSKAVSQVIAKATTTTALVSSRNPSSFGQSVTFTATVTPRFGGTPAGTVTFKNGTTTLGTATLSNGAAKFVTTKLPVGSASITAVYAGNSSFLASTSSALIQVVNQAGTTTSLGSSLNPAAAGQSVTLTATVAGQFGGTVTGSVTFFDGTTTLKTVSLSAGAAKYTTSTLASGTHDIKGAYSGSSNFSSSSAALTQTVN